MSREVVAQERGARRRTGSRPHEHGLLAAAGGTEEENLPPSTFPAETNTQRALRRALEERPISIVVKQVSGSPARTYTGPAGGLHDWCCEKNDWGRAQLFSAGDEDPLTLE